jgi:hypothetical protein
MRKCDESDKVNAADCGNSKGVLLFLETGAPRRFMERVTGLCPSSFSNFHVLAYL